MTRRLTLSFDNGPTPGITEGVLDALADADVRATFFLVGSQLARPGARALAERARKEGHWIGNHTFSHGEPLGLRAEPGAADEILLMHDLLGELAGDEPLFRPNGRARLGPHLLNREAVGALRQISASIVLWTSVPKDRKVDVDHADSWLQQAKRDVLRNDWTLMVLHDRPSGHAEPGPMAFLPDFLAWVKREAEIVQQFPSHCMPMVAGEPQPGLAELVTP